MSDVAALHAQVAKALEDRKAAIAAEMSMLLAVSANPGLFASSSVFPVASSSADGGGTPFKDILQQAAALTAALSADRETKPGGRSGVDSFFDDGLVELMSSAAEGWATDAASQASEISRRTAIDKEMERLRSAAMSGDLDVNVGILKVSLNQSLEDRKSAIVVEMEQVVAVAPLLREELAEVQAVVEAIEEYYKEQHELEQLAEQEQKRVQPDEEGSLPPPSVTAAAPTDKKQTAEQLEVAAGAEAVAKPEASAAMARSNMPTRAKPDRQARLDKIKEQHTAANVTEKMIEIEAAALHRKAGLMMDAEGEPSKPPPPKTPVWKDPATGQLVPVESRREYLRTSKAYKECWEGVLAKCIKTFGKSELEQRVNLLTATTSSYATPAQAFCALAECQGAVQQAAQKLKLVGYRDEMALAVEVTNAEQYVRVSQSKGEKKDKKDKKERKKQELSATPSPIVSEIEGGERLQGPIVTTSPKKPALWKDPVTGQMMDPVQRKAYLLVSPAYKQCWEEVLGKLVKGAEKGSIEKGIQKICAACSKSNPKVTPEIAFVALAECVGNAQHAIAKLRNPGYVEEMRIADECCKVSQYVRVSKKSPKKDTDGESPPINAGASNAS